MWLINTDTLTLEEFSNADDQQYAILSHRWQHDEILFEDMKAISTCSKAGLKKFMSCCELARSLDFRYVWIDTCCIDKKSSAELSEAINSMFNWYKSAKLCLAFLSDVQVTKDEPGFEQQFRSSAWFTRSWTLQELIAPRQRLIFYNADWQRLGSKFNFLTLVADITNIDAPALMDARLSDYSIAERMNWASRRKATRVEDIAYSLLGIFDANMPMLYGEGHQAFIRLQEEIVRYSDDETIFAWSLPPDSPDADPTSGLLASSPLAFEFCHGLKPMSLNQQDTAFVLTNRGLTSKRLLASHESWRRERRVSFPQPPGQSQSMTNIHLTFLNAAFTSQSAGELFVGIYLRRTGVEPHNYVRAFGGMPGSPLWIWNGWYTDIWSCEPQLEEIAVRHKGRSKSAILPKQIGMELSSVLRSRSPHPSNADSTSAGVVLALGAARIETSTRIVRNLLTQSGPICLIELNGRFKNLRAISLGILPTLEPYCIIIDYNFAQKSYVKVSGSEKSSMEKLPTLDKFWNFSIDERQIPWTKFDAWSKMDPKQFYTGLWAFKGHRKGSSAWTCLQPSWIGGQYKDRDNWTFRFVPYQESYHELWQVQLEDATPTH